ncbi:FG-GAP-like repeat-containing protein [Streptomyces sp. NPDC003362]
MYSRTLQASAVAVAAASAVIVLSSTAPAGAYGDSSRASRASASSPAPAVSTRADFDGDGYADVAIAAPGGTVGGRSGAGYVAVVYGMAAGPDGVKRQIISQNRYGVPGTAETGDRFGDSLEAADLDGDGFTDLVVTAPGEDVGDARDRGTQTVLWGGVGGLATGASLGTGRSATEVGDFDGDGHLDLASADRLRYGPVGRTGQAARTTPLVAPDAGIRGVRALRAGDVDGDGVTDLVISAASAGTGGLTAIRLRLLRGGDRGLEAGPVIAAADTVSAESVALGDTDGDGRQDVVFGRPGAAGGGLVGVVRGTDDGLAPRAAFIGQNTPGVPGTGENGDRFGTDVRVGDVTGDGYADVVTGVPGEDLAGRVDAGGFAVLRGSATGITGHGAVTVSQNTAGVPGTAENGDAFGSAVAVVGGHVAVSAPKENGGTGAVWVLAGSGSGVDPAGSVSFGPRTLAAPVPGARFGSAFHQ